MLLLLLLPVSMITILACVVPCSSPDDCPHSATFHAHKQDAGVQRIMYRHYRGAAAAAAAAAIARVVTGWRGGTLSRTKMEREMYAKGLLIQ
jgi:hypothetical protein